MGLCRPGMSSPGMTHDSPGTSLRRSVTIISGPSRTATARIPLFLTGKWLHYSTASACILSVNRLQRRLSSSHGVLFGRRPVLCTAKAPTVETYAVPAQLKLCP